MSNEKEDARGCQLPAGASEETVSLAIAACGHAEPTAELLAKPPPALTIEVALASKLSLADFQNAIPLLRELVLASTLAGDTGQVELSLSSTPAFVKSRTWHLDAIKAGDRYDIRDLDVQLDGALLTRLTERVRTFYCAAAMRRWLGARNPHVPGVRSGSCAPSA